jgi:hypothetical protein
MNELNQECDKLRDAIFNNDPEIAMGIIDNLK